MKHSVQYINIHILDQPITVNTQRPFIKHRCRLVQEATQDIFVSNTVSVALAHHSGVDHRFPWQICPNSTGQFAKFCSSPRQFSTYSKLLKQIQIYSICHRQPHMTDSLSNRKAQLNIFNIPLIRAQMAVIFHGKIMFILQLP